MIALTVAMEILRHSAADGLKDCCQRTLRGTCEQLLRSRERSEMLTERL